MVQPKVGAGTLSAFQKKRIYFGALVDQGTTRQQLHITTMMQTKFAGPRYS